MPTRFSQLAGCTVVLLASICAGADDLDRAEARFVMYGNAGCSANALFLASSLVGEPTPYSRIANLLPPTEDGHAASSIRDAAIETGLGAASVWIDAESAPDLRDTAIVLIPSATLDDPGHWVVVRPVKDAWIVCDFPESSPYHVDPSSWVTALLEQAARRGELGWRLPAVLVGSDRLSSQIDSGKTPVDGPALSSAKSIPPAPDGVVEHDLGAAEAPPFVLLSEWFAGNERVAFDAGRAVVGIADVRTELVVLNDTERSVRVVGQSTTCGCADVEIAADVWEPDELVVLSVTLNSRELPGPQSDTVTLRLEGKPGAETVMRIPVTASWVEGVRAEPAVVQIDPKAVMGDDGEFTVRIDAAPEVTLLANRVGLRDGGGAVEIVSVDRGSEQGSMVIVGRAYAVPDGIDDEILIVGDHAGESINLTIPVVMPKLDSAPVSPSSLVLRRGSGEHEFEGTVRAVIGDVALENVRVFQGEGSASGVRAELVGSNRIHLRIIYPSGVSRPITDRQSIVLELKDATGSDFSVFLDAFVIAQ